MPLCIQTRASGQSARASVWAISFSWWGKTRSMPPPWTSKGAQMASVIAEHSMCQPGRPGPTGSPSRGLTGLGAFHRAKSAGCA